MLPVEHALKKVHVTLARRMFSGQLYQKNARQNHVISKGAHVVYKLLWPWEEGRILLLP